MKIIKFNSGCPNLSCRLKNGHIGDCEIINDYLTIIIGGANPK